MLLTDETLAAIMNKLHDLVTLTFDLLAVISLAMYRMPSNH